MNLQQSVAKNRTSAKGGGFRPYLGPLSSLSSDSENLWIPYFIDEEYSHIKSVSMF